MRPWVLLVEDNPDDSELMEYAWQGLEPPARLETARDGLAALGRLEECTRARDTLPALTLIDLKMPRMDGFELLARLRESPNLSSMPAVVCSSSGEPGDIERCYRAGANGYVVKPREVSEYRSLVLSLDSFWVRTNRVVGVIGG